MSKIMTAAGERMKHAMLSLRVETKKNITGSWAEDSLGTVLRRVSFDPLFHMSLYGLHSSANG